MGAQADSLYRLLGYGYWPGRGRNHDAPGHCDAAGAAVYGGYVAGVHCWIRHVGWAADLDSLLRSTAHQGTRFRHCHIDAYELGCELCGWVYVPVAAQ